VRLLTSSPFAYVHRLIFFPTKRRAAGLKYLATRTLDMQCASCSSCCVFFPGSIAMHSTRCGLLPLMLRALSVTTENATHETAAEMRKLLLYLAKMTVNGVISLHLKKR